MAARQLNAKKPQDLRYTLRMLLSYMGRHKFILLLVAILVTISAVANLLGTYMIRPVVNNLASGNIRDLLMGVLLTAAIYGVGALSAYGYTGHGKSGPAGASTIFAGICSPICRHCPSSSLIPSGTAT
ncbi:MAG: hypothetical protein ACLS8R_03015 [Anaeromassilibacillus sp.]